ncbi:hypothetical protein BV898_03917 [Hypsibius exemplaris]|uniref:Uncharacterized protein n=1 Tax=Hypsibius exemplaris TaxID=2072580 RepID=A0A1W0X3R6_HYPEX|nr:hypothetical protein BV898_03917 [Hypsibius exemplaris]
MAEIVAEECRGYPSRQKNVFVLQNNRLTKFKNGRRKHYGFGNFFNEVFFPEGYPAEIVGHKITPAHLRNTKSGSDYQTDQ